MKNSIRLLLLLTFILCPLTGWAEDEAKREEDAKDRFKIRNEFLLPLPKKAPSSKACPDCHSIILADDRELTVFQGHGRYVERKLIALLKPEAFEGGEFRTPVIRSDSKTHYFLSARVMTPDGKVIEAQEKDVHMELAGGREKDEEGAVRFVVSMPGLEVGGVLQLVIEKEFSSSPFIQSSASGVADVSWYINDIFSFGDGESPVLNSRLTLTHPKNVDLKVYTYPEKGWHFKDYGVRYKGQSPTVAYRYGTFKPKKKEEYIPSSIITHPTVVLHVASNKADRFYDEEQASTWDEVIKGNEEAYREYLNFWQLPKQIRKFKASGATPADQAESLRRFILANMDSILGGKLHRRDLEVPSEWFMGYLVQKKIPFDWVWANNRHRLYDPAKVAEASLGNTLVRLKGSKGDVFISPYNLRYPQGSLPSSIMGRPFYACANGGKTVSKGVLPAPKADSASRTYTFTGSYDFDGGLQGEVKASYGGILDGSSRNSVAGWEAKDKKKNVEGRLRQRSKSLTIAEPRVDSPDAPFKGEGFTMSAQVSLEEWGLDSGDELVVTPLLFSPEPPAGFISKRKYPVEWNYPETVREELRIDLPDGYLMEEPFEAVHFDHQDLSYHLEVVQEGQTLVVRKELKYKTLVVPLDRYPTLREDLATIAKAERQDIILTIQ